MTDENAALAEDNTALVENQEGQDQQPIEESAPSAEESTAKPDAVQARINKVVGQKHEALRAKEAAEARALELEQQLQTQAPVKADGAPRIEDFDYDDSKYQEALIDYKVNLKAQEFQQQQAQISLQQEQQQIQNNWNAKLTTMAEEDYLDTVQNLPPLPNETLGALMQAENGPKIAYYLGKHLDIADEIARQSPAVAAMRLGEISAKLSNANPNDKPSAAPDPIDPINSGGTATPEEGPLGATYE